MANRQVDPVEQYALDVVSGKEIAGPLVRLACQRHLRDLEESKNEKRGIWWDWPAAERVINFFRDVLFLSGSEHEGRPFVLAPAQQFIVGSLYGWKMNADGSRRFRVAYVEMGKGNGKSPLAGGIGAYMLAADGCARAEVYAGAVHKDQARILFRDAVTMVDQSPALSRRITKSGGKNGDLTKVYSLAHIESGSFFRPISSESRGRGQSGFRPYCMLLDEIHEHPTSAMVEFTLKNMKGRPNALALMMTNSGVVDAGSVCYQYHEYSKGVLDGTRENDDRYFAFVCGLDEGDDWKDRKVWPKSNPMLGVSVSEAYLEDEVKKALGMPHKQSLTRRLNFCEWVGSENPFVSPEVWAQNGESVSRESLRGRRCLGGLDLSGKNDLTALVLEFPLDDDTSAILPFFWAPGATLREHGERDQINYQQWAEDEYLLTTPGKVIGYDFVAAQIAELAAEFDVESIAFDKWHIDLLAKELDAIGANVTLVKHGQGFQGGDLAMGASITALEDALLNGALKHGNHPVLTWCVNNARVETDAAGNRKFDKRKATGRIDGAVALAMARGLASQESGRSNDVQCFVLGG